MAYVVSCDPLELGAEVRGLETLPTMAAARSRAAALPHSLVWIARVARGLVRRVTEHVNLPPPQVRLFPARCAECGTEFHPLARGRPATFCPTCRPARRARMFAARARLARGASSSSAGGTSTSPAGSSDPTP